MLTMRVGNTFLAYCLDERELEALMRNVLLMKGHIEELKVLIRGIANIEEGEDE